MNEVRNILIGLDLTAKGSQTSYYDRQTKEPVSAPVKVGTNLYVYPTAICKMEGRKEWHTGIEAGYFGSQPGGIAVPDFFERLSGTQSCQVEGRDYRPSELLAIYLRDLLMLQTGGDDVKVEATEEQRQAMERTASLVPEKRLIRLMMQVSELYEVLRRQSTGKRALLDEEIVRAALIDEDAQRKELTERVQALEAELRTFRLKEE